MAALSWLYTAAATLGRQRQLKPASTLHRDRQVAEKKARELVAREGEAAGDRAREGARVRALQAVQVPG